MSRVFLRRGRILPGPLKVLQEAEGRSPVPMASLALTSAVLAAGLLLIPQLSPRTSVDPQPMVEVAEAGPEARPSLASAPLLIAATPAPVEPVVTPPPAQAVIAAPEPSRPVPPAPVQQAAAPAAKPAVDRSLFELDLLPVLQAGSADLDIGAVAPPKVLPRATARRTAARSAVVATDGSAEP